LTQLSSCDNLTNWSTSYITETTDFTDKVEGSGALRLESQAAQFNGYAAFDKGYNHQWDVTGSLIKLALKTSDPTRRVSLYLYGSTGGNDVWDKWARYDLPQIPANTWVEMTVNPSTPPSASSATPINLNAVGWLRFEFTNANVAGITWLIDDLRDDPITGLGDLQIRVYEDQAPPTEVNAIVEVVGVGSYISPTTIYSLPFGNYTVNALWKGVRQALTATIEAVSPPTLLEFHFAYVPLPPQVVDTFGLRITDFMADLLRPNFDDKAYTDIWSACLEDLKHASPRGEINNVQLRIWWRIDPANRATWEYPSLGTNDSGQQPFSDNWQRWAFDAGPTPLPYGPCAAQRIHDAGYHLEFCVSACWNPGYGTIADVIKPVFGWGGKEANAPDYPFDGELFLRNYMEYCVRPVAQFLAASPHFVDGDIFMIAFEMWYPTADITWSHNDAWRSIIAEVRQIFAAAGKPNVLLTIDHSSPYDDFGLGYNAVKTIDPAAPITSVSQGISGALYLADLDFISISLWDPVLIASQIPVTWTDTDIPWVTDAWFTNLEYYRVGTGYSGIPGVLGRDVIQDYRTLAQLFGKRILFNSGWVNRHGRLAWNTYSGGAVADNEEQKIAWASQLLAILDNRSNPSAWNAGQDFERYIRDKAAQPDFMDASYRKAPAQQAIIDIIRQFMAIPPPDKGNLEIHTYLDNVETSMEGKVQETGETFTTPAMLPEDPGTYVVIIGNQTKTAFISSNLTTRLDFQFTTPISLNLIVLGSLIAGGVILSEYGKKV